MAKKTTPAPTIAETTPTETAAVDAPVEPTPEPAPDTFESGRYSTVNEVLEMLGALDTKLRTGELGELRLEHVRALQRDIRAMAPAPEPAPAADA